MTNPPHHQKKFSGMSDDALLAKARQLASAWVNEVKRPEPIQDELTLALLELRDRAGRNA